jgi:hypothetical protein
MLRSKLVPMCGVSPRSIRFPRIIHISSPVQPTRNFHSVFTACNATLATTAAAEKAAGVAAASVTVQKSFK